MKKVSVIFGAPGIGKTTAAKVLYQRINHAQYVDVDDLWRIHPFIVNEENKVLVETNLKHLYQSFLDHPTLEHFIVTWVVPTEGLKNLIFEWFKDSEVHFYRLVAKEDVYLKRLINDHRDQTKFDDYKAINSKNEYKDVKTIDVSEMDIKDVVDVLYQELKGVNNGA
ncbi:hypothetical protein BK011_03230 [Tenericutes bacterium MZ-XQ]|jgi:adenylate kinase family enzyme|nr:hypothetical protein BK011_03230 [Tenericutes bacterium MZ-XQ]